MCHSNVPANTENGKEMNGGGRSGSENGYFQLNMILKASGNTKVENFPLLRAN